MTLAKRFIKEFQRRLVTAANETEVRSAFHATVELILGINDLKFERGRTDLRRNKVIFEFKDKGLFNGSVNSIAFRTAYKKLITKYIPAKAEEDNLPEYEYIGVAIDGIHIALVFFEENGKARHTGLVNITEEVIGLIIQLLQEDKRRPLTGPNLIEDFGPESSVTKRLILALWNHLNQGLSYSLGIPKVKMLYKEWRKLFSQATSLGKIGQERIDNHLRQLGMPTTDDYTKVLFVLHTYNSILFKLLAAELVTSIRYSDEISGYCLSLLCKDNQEMSRALKDDIEYSRLFKERGIKNFVEGTFFSWYTEGNNFEVMNAIRGILEGLTRYIFPTKYSNRITDLVKYIYENIVPEPLRKNIGEFYTPEWLVEFTLNELGYNGQNILGKKILDPTCGSGNFLIHAIQRYKEQALKAGWSNEQILKSVVRDIIGFDLSPLAVLAARLNYLLQVSDVLDANSEIEIPVFLADAVYAPTVTDSTKDRNRVYSVGTVMGNIDLTLPEELVQDTGTFEKVLEEMENWLEAQLPFDIFFKQLFKIPQLQHIQDKLPEWEYLLKDMYDKVLELEVKNWNRIWCRIIRNYFASIAVGQVDFIVGNPPWVRWSELPEDYRVKVKPTCDSYNIFSETPFFGGNELDISAIISYSVADKWLSTNGTMAFVITQIHFQAPSSQGFRRFKLLDGTTLKVILVHDWEKVRPFPKLANKPVVFVWKKGEITQFPVRYIRWYRKKHTHIYECNNWAETENKLISKELGAIPIPPDDRWAILPIDISHIVQYLKGGSKHYKGRKGITTDLNGVYFVDVHGPGQRPGTLRVSNSPDAGRKPIPNRTFEIEEELIYPLLKGAADFKAFKPNTLKKAVIIPNTTIHNILPEEEFMEYYPLAYRYFKLMNRAPRHLLSNRSTWKSRMKPNDAPFYAIYNIGPYTFSKYKVVWAEMAGTIEAAVFGEAQLLPGHNPKPIVPDHKIYFLPCSDENIAHFVCALLNSEIVSTFINSFTVKLQVGTIFRHLKLPQFDPTSRLHKRIANLSRLAHKVGINKYIQNIINYLALRIIQVADNH